MSDKEGESSNEAKFTQKWRVLLFVKPGKPIISNISPKLSPQNFSPN